jgi:hypothetical protein
MKVLVIGHLTGKDITPHLAAEGRRVAELRAEGLIRDVFLKADRSGPICCSTTPRRATPRSAWPPCRSSSTTWSPSTTSSSTTPARPETLVTQAGRRSSGAGALA